jgi:hypothetical protein
VYRDRLPFASIYETRARPDIYSAEARSTRREDTCGVRVGAMGCGRRFFELWAGPQCDCPTGRPARKASVSSAFLNTANIYKVGQMSDRLVPKIAIAI